VLCGFLVKLDWQITRRRIMLQNLLYSYPSNLTVPHLDYNSFMRSAYSGTKTVATTLEFWNAEQAACDWTKGDSCNQLVGLYVRIVFESRLGFNNWFHQRNWIYRKNWKDVFIRSSIYPQCILVYIIPAVSCQGSTWRHLFRKRSHVTSVDGDVYIDLVCRRHCYQYHCLRQLMCNDVTASTITILILQYNLITARFATL